MFSFRPGLVLITIYVFIGGAAFGSDAVPLANWSVPGASRGEATIGAMSHNSEDGTRFVDVTPCRVLDTRDPAGPFGGPKFTSGSTRVFDVDAGPCTGISKPTAYSLNFSVTETEALGYLTAWPAGSPQPTVATMTWFGPSQTLSNAAIVPANAAGEIAVFLAATTHVIIDINGYFTSRESAGHVVEVAATGSDTQNGTALKNALADITGASATNPFVLKLGPGVYNIGTFRLAMKEFVDMEGSGETTTIIKGTAASAATEGVVLGMSNSEIRLLTIECAGGGTHCTALYNGGESPKITHVTVKATGGTTENLALYNDLSSNPIVSDLTAFASGPGTNYGIQNRSSSPSMVNLDVTAQDGLTNVGIYNTSGSQAEIRGAEVRAIGIASSTNTGIKVDASAAPTISDVMIRSSGLTNSVNYAIASSGTGNGGRFTEFAAYASSGANAYGVHISGTSATLVNGDVRGDGGSVNNTGIMVLGNAGPTISEVTVGASGTSSRGLWAAGSASVRVHRSRLSGTTRSIEVAAGNTVRIATSLIEGGTPLNAGTLSCIYSYNNLFTAVTGGCL